MNLDCQSPDLMFRRSVYRIRVAGRLGPEWSEFLGGKPLSYKVIQGFGVTTEFEASFMDQAALMGVLQQLYDRHAPVVSVTCVVD